MERTSNAFALLENDINDDGGGGGGAYGFVTVNLE